MFRVRLFGATRVEIDGVAVPAARLGGVKSRRVLQVLALQAGAPIDKERLADLVWEGEPPASAVATLESYVCVLRRSLQLGAGRHSALATTSKGYVLDPERFEVDLSQFRQLTEGLSALIPAQRVTDALSLVSGELLDDEPFAAWAVRARECFRRELVTACAAGSRAALNGGDLAEAERLAWRAVTADPLSEEATQQLMRALWQAGRRSEALRGYLGLRQVMLDELGDEPGLATRDLYLAILRDGPNGQPDFGASTEAEVSLLLRLLTQAMESLPGGPATAARLLQMTGFRSALAPTG